MTQIPLENQEAAWQYRVVQPTLSPNGIFLSEYFAHNRVPAGYILTGILQ
jgi:hypothetical protein